MEGLLRVDERELHLFCFAKKAAVGSGGERNTVVVDPIHAKIWKTGLVGKGEARALGAVETRTVAQ